MKFNCPVCGSDLEYTRVDDGFVSYRVFNDDDGLVDGDFIASSSDGYTMVRCMENQNHDIPLEVQEKVIDYIETTMDE